jgi:uncharacterized protein DUF4229
MSEIVRRFPVLVFTLLRVGLFLVVLALLYVLGLQGLPLLVIAILISGLASLPLLATQRAAVANRVAERSRRSKERLEAAGRSDDELIEGLDDDGEPRR